MDYWKRAHRRRPFDEPGHAHELTFTCFRRFRFLDAERTCTWLAQAIERARVRLDFDLWAYVFMPEHAHLIVWPRRPKSRIAPILKAIKQPVGQRGVAYLEANAPRWLPRITRVRGGRTERLFWQSGGGYDRNLIVPRTLAATIDYPGLFTNSLAERRKLFAVGCLSLTLPKQRPSLTSTEPETLKLVPIPRTSVVNNPGYVHQNPVRRGLVPRAEEWRWSSAGWFEGRGRNPLQPDRIPPEWSMD